MKIHELKPAKGSRPARKRKGRGMGSGSGKTSGRGHKGRGARSGARKKFGFEGGQMPLARRMPKVGFAVSCKKTEFHIVNLEKLNIFKEETHITPSLLREKGLIRNTSRAVKILGKGQIQKKIKISAHAFSKVAKSAIEKLGGSIEIIK